MSVRTFNPIGGIHFGVGAFFVLIIGHFDKKCNIFSQSDKCLAVFLRPFWGCTVRKLHVEIKEG